MVALLLIDIQNDYFPGGAMEVPDAETVAEKASGMVATFREKSLPVIHIQHIAARRGARFLLPGTHGAEIHVSVAPAPGEPVFQKHFPSAFHQTPLLDHLRGSGLSRLVIAGMMTQMCIDSTVRAAQDLGFRSSLASDACAARPMSFGGVTVSADSVQAAFLSALDGLFAKVAPAGELIAGL
ncbi:MAG: cysteine hydrolase family protein [Candidatus Fermentibacter sp.]|nr:cysteine hydrolase family protein [Candidatus Fermentibacter sp.]